MRAVLSSFLCALALLASAPADAQVRAGSQLQGEFAHLREAADLETRGDLAASEAIVREVLRANPTSLVALLALERLLAQQGRAAELLGAAERVLTVDPGSTVAHQVRLRVLAHADDPRALEQAGREWLAAVPSLETPYRELAAAWLRRSDPVRALQVLEEGRVRIGAPDALALELGEVHAASGNAARAAAEWSRAIGASGQGFASVQRRLAQLPDAGAAVVAPLVLALAEPPGGLPRRRAAAQLALQAGLAEPAEALITALAADLPPTAREAFLAETARRADGAGLERVALWSYQQLLQLSERDTTRLLALRTRIAQLSLAAGDTAGAAAMYATLERAGAPGSPQRRQAVAASIELGARGREAADLEADLDAFRAEYPDAPELPGIAAAAGAALLERRDLTGAERVLTGIAGPEAALVRGRVFLRRGELDRARAELLFAAPSLRGAEATRTLATIAALAHMGPGSGPLVASALEQADDDAAHAVHELITGSGALPARERAALLDFAASLADGASLEEAAELARRAIVADHPGSDPAPAALLWLAQRAAAQAANHEEARVLLERLIVEHPRSALVPQARRALERITDAGAAAAPQQGR